MPLTHSFCPVCRGASLEEVVVIRQVPVYCNVLWPSREEAQRATRGDIVLTFCADCGHLFNKAFDPALIEYDQAYENSLHFSPRFQAYATRLADELRERHSLQNKTIVEIGSGQGDFLELLCRDGSNRGLGFDPSYRPEESSVPSYLQFIPDLYGENYADYEADFICCRHVLEHIAEPDPFIAMVRRTARAGRGTTIFFEVPNVMYTLRDLGIWDLIYEHISYFSGPSLTALLERNGFQVLSVQETFGKQFLTIEAVAASVLVLEDRPESQEGELLRGAVAAFADSYRDKVEHWRQQLGSFASDGRRVALWGSGSKGITFLNVLANAGSIGHVVDINPRKQGMFTAGTGHEIVAPEALRAEPPDVVIVMNPNYQDEIRDQLQELGLPSELMVA